MLGAGIPSGALYYGTTKRREAVEFDERLRHLTEATCARLHELITGGRTPRAVREPKCDQCSLLNICMPDALPGRSALRYTERALAASLRSVGSGDTE